MSEIAHGSVVLYSYLWARERDRGEESGRKARAVCVMIILRGPNGVETPLLFPVTSRRPFPDRRAVEIPETEARRARLYTPAWVIVDEFNTDDLRNSFAIEDRQPLGVFSRKFMARISAEAAAAIRAGGARAVPRR
ncbi:MAG: hypothetical protein L0I29_09100 [Hyphomicrobiales bacterium]|nr:hypothetical protein [Hyphomicrobiales bacterium]